MECVRAENEKYETWTKRLVFLGFSRDFLGFSRDFLWFSRDFLGFCRKS